MSVRSASASQEVSRLGEYRVWTNGGGLVHSTSAVDPTTVVQVGAIVHENATVAGGGCIGSGSQIGPGVTIGADAHLSFNVSLSNCTVGAACVFHNGVCIGQDGFGFLVDEKTGAVVKKPQLLNVIIGNDVEIGANSCVDRGSWRDTVIGNSVKIDNLVQIGHNVIIGDCCFLCGHVALGGSSELGSYVVMGGKSAVADHVTVCSKVRIAAKAGVIHNITEPGDYAGYPNMPLKTWKQQIVEIRRIAKRAEKERANRLKNKGEEPKN